MKYLMKKVTVFIMVVVLAISSGYGFQVNKTDRVKAANATFATLKSQYPSGSTWNGSYKNKAWQCHGFACMLGDALTGTDPYTWPKLNNLSSLKPGDIIRCSRPHSIMVTGVSGDTITYVDCNWVGKNTVKWDQTIARSNITGKFGSLICVMSYTGTVPPDPIIPNPDPVVPKPAINNVKIDSIDFRHITLSFSAYNSGLVRVVAVSKTTGQEVKQDFTSGLENVRYTFETSSMGNPGKDFYIRIYAYSTPSGGNETLHAVTYGPEIGSVKLPDKELQYNMETLPQDVVVTETSLRGWVIGENITKVTTVINSLEYECTREKRDDVGNAFPGYDSSQAGFRFNFNVFDLDNGSNTLSVRAYTSDVDYVELYNGKMEVIKLSPYYVDWSWYYFNYHNEPEIAAIGLNPEKLIEYYYTKGIAKGHSPCMGFDPKWYLEKNGDIKAVGNITDMVGAYVHFVKYCLPDNEKRNLSPFLDLKYYQDNNADLAGKKADELFYHYYRWGSRLESRSNSNNTNQAKAFAKLFVANEYAAANGDVQAVTGDGKTVESAENVWSQFFAYMLPRNDKRVTSNQFDMAFYMNKYGIATTEEAFWRYINSGYANGEITKQETTVPTKTPTVEKVFDFGISHVDKNYGDEPFINSLIIKGYNTEGTLLSYSSGDKKIATIDQTGKVTITGAGLVAIHAYLFKIDESGNSYLIGSATYWIDIKPEMTVKSYEGTFDGLPHSATIDVIGGGTVYYSTDKELTSNNYDTDGKEEMPVRVDAGTTKVYYIVKPQNGLGKVSDEYIKKELGDEVFESGYTTINISKATPILSFDSSSITKKSDSGTFVNTLTKTTDGNVTFSSSNTSVATVDGISGKVTIQGSGTTTITATSTEGTNYTSGSVSYMLRVEDSDADICITPLVTVTPEITEIPENTTKPQTVPPQNSQAPILGNTDVPPVTEKPVITRTPASTTPQTSAPKDTTKPQTTFAVPTMPPTGDGDFSEDFITKIELYSDLDKEEQLRVGDSFNLYADIEPEEFEDTELLWSSNNEKIATVDKKGNVKCVGVGTVTITVTATDGSGKSASMTFAVKKALGSDSNLSGIKVSQGKLTPAFKKTKKSYSLVLSKNMSKAVIKVKKSDSAAKVKINGKTTEKITVNLKRGQTKKVTIRVIAENGKGQTYQIKVKRKK